MPISSGDITLRLSGGASNSNTATSLGGLKSTTVMPTNLFDDVTNAEAVAGDVEYRCIYVNNANATDTLFSTKFWIQTNTPSAGTDFAIGLGTAGLNATEQSVANENTAPTGVSFSSPSTYAAGLSLGDIPSGQHYSVWLRRTVQSGTTPVSSDTVTFAYAGDYVP